MAPPRVIGLLLLACFAVHAVSAAEVRKLLDTNLAVGSSGASAEGGYTASASSGSTSSTTPTSAYTSQGATADASNGYYYYSPVKTDVSAKGVAVSSGGYYFYPSTSIAVDKATADCDAYGNCHSGAGGSSYATPYTATATSGANSAGSYGADVDTSTFTLAKTTTPWYGRKLMTLAVGSSGASAEGGYSASASSGSTSSTTPTSAYTSQGATADASGYGSKTDVYVKGVAVQNGGYYYPSNLAVDKASADCDSYGNCHSGAHGYSSANLYTGAAAGASANSNGYYGADVDTNTFTLAKTTTPYWIGR